MTKRLTLAILLTVLISVVLSGLGTLLLSRHEDRLATIDDLESSANALAFMFGEVSLAAPNDAENIRIRLARVREELRLADAELIIVRRGEVVGEVPESLGEVDVGIATLREQGTVSGSIGSTVYAAAYGERRNLEYVLILTSDSNRLTRPLFRWVVLSTVIAVAAGALIAWILGRAIAAPLKAASRASRQIAKGDLSARVTLSKDRDDEIGELAEAINDMAASLDRSRGLERQFLLSVSHDLRTPLTSIRGYAEAIADGTAEDEARAASIISSESRRLERLVNDLLDLANLEARQFRLEPRPTDLSILVPDVGAGFEHQANQHGVEVLIDGPDSPLLAHADPDRLAQAIANLVENALKFAQSRVILTYSTSAVGPQIVVADDGAGIASEDLPHVFERLYVANRTPRRRETGSGLGLAIVKELVEAMGGTVTALPRPTGGTQFVITLIGSAEVP